MIGVVTLLRDVEAAVAEKMDRWLLAPHEPIDVWGDDPVPPGEPVQWCIRCQRAWPCEDFVRISDRIVARSKERTS
jgi:hypothetical protein